MPMTPEQRAVIVECALGHINRFILEKQGPELRRLDQERARASLRRTGWADALRRRT
jgi:hypothetical protein